MAELMQVEINEWFALPRGPVEGHCFAIGDTHGYSDELAALQAHLVRMADAEGTRAKLVYLGDYIDRGPDSLGVLDQVRTGTGSDALEEVVLRGNHDQYLISALSGAPDDMLDHWLRYGGTETLASIGVERSLRGDALAEALRAALGPERCAWLEDLPLTHRVGGAVFVHAGLNPQRSFAEQDADDLIWIRREFLDCHPDDWPFEEMVVHGHTPDAFGCAHHRIGVDSGCYMTGVLAAVELFQDRGRFHRTVPQN